MKILFAASEMAPFASTGALGESVAALAGALKSNGHEVSVVLPFYRSVRERGKTVPKKTGAKFLVQVGDQRLPCEIREARSPEGVQTFFVDRDEFFDRTGLYGVEGRDYQDNSTRFTYFAKCVVEVMRRMDPSPEVVHAHDWQAGLVPVFARDAGLNVRTVLGIGSLKYQGNFWSYDFGLTNLPGRYFSAQGLEYFGSLNFLKGGILFADRVILPGSRWVGESQTREFGSGLDPVLREHASKIEGILPGADLADWNPATDKGIPKRFRAPSGKIANRRALLGRTGLDADPAGPVALVIRDATVGFDGTTLIDGIDRLAPMDGRFVVLGDVPRKFISEMTSAARRHRGKVVWMPEYTEEICRSALAGSDVILLPSAAHPDVTWCVRALRYGLVPVHAACAGISLLLPKWHPGSDDGFAFPFYSRTPEALADAFRKFVSVWKSPGLRETLISRTMAADFSWSEAARKTEHIYRSLSGSVEAAA